MLIRDSKLLLGSPAPPRPVWKRLLNSGTAPEQPSQLQKRIVLTNRLVLTSIFFTLTLIPMFYFIGLDSLIFVPPLICAAYAAALVLNYMQWHKTARLWFLHSAIFSILFLSYSLGRGAWFQAFFLVTAVGFIVLFEEKDRLWVLYGAILNTLAVLFSVDRFERPLAPIEESALNVLAGGAVIITFLVISIWVYLLVVVNDKAETILQDTLGSIRRDLTLARKIQTATLPDLSRLDSTVETFSVFKPMSEVGGDIFDVHQVRSDLLRIFIADATGHGIQAALISMAILGQYGNVRDWDLPPDAILAALNSGFMRSYNFWDSFFTAGVLDIDLKRGSLVYAGGGHPYPVLMNGEGESQFIKANGFPLGLRESSEYKSVELEFPLGSTAYFFTDGVFEEFNAAHEEFGVRRVLEILSREIEKPLHEGMNLVLHGMQKFQGNIPRSDDLTFIGVRRKNAQS